MIVCRLKLACDGTPQPETNFYWLARERKRDHSCRACRRQQQRARRIAAGRSQSKRDVAYKGFSPVARTFCSLPRPPLPEMLTTSEIRSLRRAAKENGAYARKAFAHLRPKTPPGPDSSAFGRSESEA